MRYAKKVTTDRKNPNTTILTKLNPTHLKTRYTAANITTNNAAYSPQNTTRLHLHFGFLMTNTSSSFTCPASPLTILHASANNFFNSFSPGVRIPNVKSHIKNTGTVRFAPSASGLIRPDVKLSTGISTTTPSNILVRNTYKMLRAVARLIRSLLIFNCSNSVFFAAPSNTVFSNTSCLNPAGSEKYISRIKLSGPYNRRTTALVAFSRGCRRTFCQ